LPVAAGHWRDGFGREDVDVPDGSLDAAAARQQVIAAPAAIDVVIGEVQLCDLRRGKRQALRRPVPLDELVLGDPVDLPRDAVQAPCLHRAEYALPQSEHSLVGRFPWREIPGRGQVLSLDVQRAQLAAVRQPQRASPGHVKADRTKGC
jgi:hypothetical protein